MVISAFKTEFNRVAAIIGAQFECLEISELEEYAQHFDFSTPLINLKPVTSFNQDINLGVVSFRGNVTLSFLTRAIISDNAETVKDNLIDEMITLSTRFYRELNKNENLVFSSPKWDWGTRVERFKTANYLVGVSCDIGFYTGCNRI